MSTVTVVRIAVPNGRDAAERLENNGISVEEVNRASVKVALETGRGDKAVKIADGTVQVVQDAMVAELRNADIAVVTDL